MAEKTVERVIDARCSFIKGLGQLEFKLESGQTAVVSCEVTDNVVWSDALEDQGLEDTSKETQPETKELKGKLPEDFPGYVALVEAGVTTYAKVRKVSDLTSIAGIGEATAVKIKAALEGSDPSTEESDPED